MSSQPIHAATQQKNDIQADNHNQYSHEHHQDNRGIVQRAKEFFTGPDKNTHDAHHHDDDHAFVDGKPVVRRDNDNVEAADQARFGQLRPRGPASNLGGATLSSADPLGEKDNSRAHDAGYDKNRPLGADVHHDSKQWNNDPNAKPGHDIASRKAVGGAGIGAGAGVDDKQTVLVTNVHQSNYLNNAVNAKKAAETDIDGDGTQQWSNHQPLPAEEPIGGPKSGCMFHAHDNAGLAKDRQPGHDIGSKQAVAGAGLGAGLAGAGAGYGAGLNDKNRPLGADVHHDSKHLHNDLNARPLKADDNIGRPKAHGAIDDHSDRKVDEKVAVVGTSTVIKEKPVDVKPAPVATAAKPLATAAPAAAVVPTVTEHEHGTWHTTKKAHDDGVQYIDNAATHTTTERDFDTGKVKSHPWHGDSKADHHHKASAEHHHKASAEHAAASAAAADAHHAKPSASHK